jgi:uncharacterized peroxidase-related enzyme
MRELAHILLHEPSSLTPGERELIAAFVSAENGCKFCQLSHEAVAARHLGNESIAQLIMTDYRAAPVSEKLKALLNIAGKVQKDGKLVTSADVEAARKEGATDREIHDTVLIAAAFCMYNRYVDGLEMGQPLDSAAYAQTAERLASQGYRPK